MAKRIKRSFIYSIIVLLILLVAAAALFFWGDRYALRTLYITSATPDQIANDMQQDDFYSTYGETTLIVQGSIASVTPQTSSTLIQFKTHSSYNAFCSTLDSSFSGKVGDTITVLAEGASAKREPHAVLLTDCVIVVLAYTPANI